MVLSWGYSNMRIAVINEDSQAEKHEMICSLLKEAVNPKGYEVLSLGMCSESDIHEINYTEIGIIASILIECKIADFIVTGCGTGQGAMMSCNSFPNVYCGYVEQPLDAYLFTQVNAGNCISIPFAQSFGWGSEINLGYVFERLFEKEFGQGYPAIYANGEKNSRLHFKENIKSKISKTVVDAIRSIDKDYLISILDYDAFKEHFIRYHQPCELSIYISDILFA